MDLAALHLQEIEFWQIQCKSFFLMQTSILSMTLDAAVKQPILTGQ